jgi:hypothetical protein
VYAHKTNRPLMVMTGDPAPGPGLFDRCLSDARVVELSKRFVCYNASSPVSLAAVTTLPKQLVPDPTARLVFFVQPNGKLISRMGAFYWPSDFAAYQRDALWIRSESPSLERDLKVNPSGDTLAQWAFVKASQGDTMSARSLSERAARNGASAQELARTYLALGDQCRVDRKLADSVPYFRKSLLHARTPMDKFKARIRLGSAYLRLQKIGEAESEIIRCIRMDGINREERETAEFFLRRVQFFKPPSAGTPVNSRKR